MEMLTKATAKNRALLFYPTLYKRHRIPFLLAASCRRCEDSLWGPICTVKRDVFSTSGLSSRLVAAGLPTEQLDHTLDCSALVHEALMRIIVGTAPDIQT